MHAACFRPFTGCSRHNSWNIPGGVKKIPFDTKSTAIYAAGIKDSNSYGVLTMKKLIEEFKQFALRGNAIDMAIGIIIGAAFSQMVNSLVNDILMPPIGWLVGGVDFSDLSITIKNATSHTEAVKLHYGLFLNTLINFSIIAMATFMIITAINKIIKKQAASSTTKLCPACALEIPVQAVRCGHCTTRFK